MVLNFTKLVLLLSILSPASCKTTAVTDANLSATTISANEEFYGDRPDIQKITPKAHKNLHSNWDQMKEGFLESVAMWNGFMPEYDKYYLARDLENLYDISRILDPKSKRHHLINVSTSLSSDPLLKDYMADNGVTEKSLKGGQKILLLDTGFSGTVPDGIMDEFSAAARKNMKGQLLSCSSGRYPSTYLFLGAVNPTITYLTTDSVDGDGIAGEVEELQKHTQSATEFQKNAKGKYDATSYKGYKGDKEKAKKFMQDLAAYAKSPAVKKRYKERITFWKELRKLNDKGNKDAVIKFFRKKLVSETTMKGKNFVQAAFLDYMDTIKFANLKGPKVTLKDFDLELYIPAGFEVDPYDIDIPDLIEEAARKKNWEKVKMLSRIGENSNQIAEMVEGIANAMPYNASKPIRQQYVDAITYIIARDFDGIGGEVISVLADIDSTLLPDVAKYMIEQSVLLGAPEVISEVMDNVTNLDGKDAQLINETIIKEFFEQKRPKNISAKYWDEIGKSGIEMIVEVGENEGVIDSPHLKRIVEILISENRYSMMTSISNMMNRDPLANNVEVLALIFQELSNKTAIVQKKYLQLFKKGSASTIIDGPGVLFSKLIDEASKLKDPKKLKQKLKESAEVIEKLLPVKFDGKAVDFVFDFTNRSLNVGNRFATAERAAYEIVAVKKLENSEGVVYDLVDSKGAKYRMLTNNGDAKELANMSKVFSSLEKAGVQSEKPIELDASYQIFKSPPQKASMINWLDKEWKSSVMPKTTKAQKAMAFLGQLIGAGVDVAKIGPADIVWVKDRWVYYGTSGEGIGIASANKTTEARIRTRWGKFISAYGESSGTTCKLLETLAGQGLVAG